MKKGKVFYRLLNMYQDESDLYRQRMVSARYYFKTCIKRYKFEYDKEQTFELVNARYTYAKSDCDTF